MPTLLGPNSETTPAPSNSSISMLSLGLGICPSLSRSVSVGSFPTAYLYAAVAVSLWTHWRRQPFLECELLPQNWGRMSAPRRVGSTGQVTPQEPAGLCTYMTPLGMGRGSVSSREQGSLSVCSQGMSSRSPMCLARQTQRPES